VCQHWIPRVMKQLVGSGKNEQRSGVERFGAGIVMFVVVNSLVVASLQVHYFENLEPQSSKKLGLIGLTAR